MITIKRDQSFNQIFEFETLKNKYLDFMLENFKVNIEKIDSEIRNADWRKELGYYINGYVERTLLTSEGILKFKRTKFKYWDSNLQKWRTKYLLDDYLQIQKNQKLSYEFQYKILEKTAQNMSPRNIIETFPRAIIHKSTISRFLQKLNVANLNQFSAQNYQIPKNANNSKTIYISTDDSFLNLKEKRIFQKYSEGNKYRVRLAILYQGIANFPDERGSILINKRIVANLEKINPDFPPNKISVFANLIRQKVLEYYGSQDWKFVVCGDGDGYVKALAQHLNAKIVLDWFHLSHKLRNTFYFTKFQKNSLDEDLFKTIANTLKKSPQLAIDNYLKPLMKTKILRTDKTEELITYIQNNLEGIKAYQEPWYNGCYTESNIYHFVKSISSGKSYNVSTFHNLFNLRISWINHLNPLEIWQDRFEKKINDNLNRQLMIMNIRKKISETEQRLSFYN